jgi:hypothetical protein
MSDLTATKLNSLVQEFYEKYGRPDPRPPGLFGSLFRPMFAGIDVFETPPPPPKIRLSKECAELVGAEFANRVNAWLLDRFGTQEDRIYMISGLGITMSKKNMAVITNLCS